MALEPMMPLLTILASEFTGMRYCRLIEKRSTTLSLTAGSNEMPVTVPTFTPRIMMGDAGCTPLIWS